jgi:hypothetical protein
VKTIVSSRSVVGCFVFHFRSHPLLFALLLIVSATLTPRLVAAQDAVLEEDAAVRGTRIFIASLSFYPVGCDMTAEERALEALFMGDPNQKRPEMVCNNTLAEVARKRAEDMANRDYLGHTNPDGEGPNYLVESAGYQLPDFYGHGRGDNNIESIGGGYSSAADLWDAWLHSGSHRTHILGDHKFYAKQTQYGIGYAYNPNSTYQRYWVLITAPPEE